MNSPLNNSDALIPDVKALNTIVPNANGPWRNVYLILMAAWRQRYLILIPIIIMPLVGGLIALTRGKIFDTHTTILVQETSKLNPFLEDLSVSTNLKERMSALNTLVHSLSLIHI